MVTIFKLIWAFIQRVCLLLCSLLPNKFGYNKQHNLRITHLNMTEQEKLIGPHPHTPHIFGEWWNYVDFPTSNTKKHRSLDEINGVRDRALDKLAQWIVDYHLTDVSKRMLDKKREILDRNALGDFVDKLHVLPINDNTQKGNLGEITLIEYLKESKGYDPLIYKIHYNPNYNQSMKGDDVLLFNRDNLDDGVIYGECKFRGTPSKDVVDEIKKNLQDSKRIPESITFVANCLDQNGEHKLADNLMEIHFKVINGVVPLTNVGFLISTKSSTPSQDTKTTVEKHLSTTNPRLVMISLGVDNPQQIVDEAYSRAMKILKTK